MKFIFIIGTLLTIFACAQDEQKIESSKKPKKVQKKKTSRIERESFKEEVKGLSFEIMNFVPEGYAVLDTVSGNLNLDTNKDLILVLKKNGEEITSDSGEHPVKRPLLILIGNNKNQYKLVKRNNNSVYCISCGGIMGDPYMGITIKNGYFSVEHYAGSAWRWTRIVTYKYNKMKDDWFLHKDGSESFHASEPEIIEANILTTKDFGNVAFEDFNIYKEE